jgi:sialate O-acetylesterase
MDFLNTRIHLAFLTPKPFNLFMKNIKHIVLVIFISVSYGKQALADVSLPAIFSDNMVLQQKTNAAMWGWADPGEQIQVENSWSKKVVKTVADQKGHWKIFIQTARAGGPYEIIIKGKNTINLKNVLLGEVWLCSGQSNMEFPVAKVSGTSYSGVNNSEQEIQQANYPDLRMFIVEKKSSAVPLEDARGSWYICSPATVGKFSAVAYYFGKEILSNVGVPVGLIHTSWGGTPAESWISKEVLQSDTDFIPILDRYNKSLEDYNKAYKTYSGQKSQWEKDSALARDKGDTIPAALKKPVEVRYFLGPAQLYNSMLYPLIPYSLRGSIWYQGESNSGRAYQYRKLLPAMINSWRKEWKMNFPFYLVQIAPYKDYGPEIREAQLMIYRSVRKTGLVVLTDAGDSVNNHPKNKEIVGKRLALWALAKDYGRKELNFSGPLYKTFKIEGPAIRIQFDFADGLILKDSTTNEFTVAGPDHKFIPAAAKIEGNTVVVWSNKITNPIAVRFSWKNVPHPVLYNGSGLPASPFRTDE